MLIEIVMAFLFVVSSGLLFSEKFRSNKFLVFVSAIIAITSTYFLTVQIIDMAISKKLNNLVVSEKNKKYAEISASSSFISTSTPPRVKDSENSQSPSVQPIVPLPRLWAEHSLGKEFSFDEVESQVSIFSEKIRYESFGISEKQAALSGSSLLTTVPLEFSFSDLPGQYTCSSWHWIPSIPSYYIMGTFSCKIEYREGRLTMVKTGTDGITSTGEFFYVDPKKLVYDWRNINPNEDNNGAGVPKPGLFNRIGKNTYRFTMLRDNDYPLMIIYRKK